MKWAWPDQNAPGMGFQGGASGVGVKKENFFFVVLLLRVFSFFLCFFFFCMWGIFVCFLQKICPVDAGICTTNVPPKTSGTYLFFPENAAAPRAAVFRLDESCG